MNRLRSVRPVWVAATIALAVVLWMASGLLGIGTAESGAHNGADSNNTAAADDKPAEPVVEVKVRISHTQTVMRTAKLAGRTAAARKVELSVQIGGQVVAITAERGDYVTQGEVIVRLDSGNLQAQLDQALALLEQRKMQYQAAQEMAAQGYQSSVALATARANLAAARAAVARIRTKIEYTTIEAPFSGVLEKLPVELGDVVSAGDVVGQVVQQDPFIVWGQVSENVVALLEPGQPGTATLISGATVHGTLRFISSVADKATQTYRVELQIDKPEDSGPLIAGASAELRLPLKKVTAHRVESSVLTLNADGVFGIKTVTDEGTVRFYKAEIVKSDDGHVWLTGLPETLRVITRGHGFVRPGDKVHYSLADQAEDTADSRTGSGTPPES